MDSESKEQDVTINSNRAAIYSFLSGVYAKELTSDQISELRTRRDDLLPSFSLASGDGEDAKQISTRSEFGKRVLRVGRKWV